MKSYDRTMYQLPHYADALKQFPSAVLSAYFAATASASQTGNPFSIDNILASRPRLSMSGSTYFGATPTISAQPADFYSMEDEKPCIGSSLTSSFQRIQVCKTSLLPRQWLRITNENDGIARSSAKSNSNNWRTHSIEHTIPT